MMSKKEKLFIPAVGGSMLLAIFAVLCLSVFSCLCLSTVLAAKRLNDASVNAVTSYYEADYEAEEIFARLRLGDVPEGVTIDGNIYRYSCPISETQDLQVQLRLADDSWSVEQWQAVSTMK